MTVLAERIYGEILDLPIEERLGLIDRLVQSITPEPQGIRQAWAEEAEHRYTAYRKGDAIPIWYTGFNKSGDINELARVH